MLEQKTNIALATTKVLGNTISEILPMTATGETTNFFFRGDNPAIESLSYPAIILVDPHFDHFAFVQQQLNIYKDYDEEALQVKQFQAPVPIKLKFSFTIMTKNPDNDIILSTFFTRCRDEVVELSVPENPDNLVYTKVPLYWGVPFDLHEVSGVRVQGFPVDAIVNIDHLKYKTRRLIDPQNPIGYTRLSDSDSYKYDNIKGTLAFSVNIGDTIVYVTEGTKDFPVSGQVSFLERDEVFTYTSKTTNSLIGSPITRWHSYGEEFKYIGSGE